VSPTLLQVVKRNGPREPFDRPKLEHGIVEAAAGRWTAERPVWRLAMDVAVEVERALGDQPVVTSGQIAAEVMRNLRHHEPVAHLLAIRKHGEGLRRPRGLLRRGRRSTPAVLI